MSDFNCWGCGGPADAVDELCADCDKARAADERKAEELRAEIERAVLAERERCVQVVESVSVAINGPEQDALQWYARHALQRAAEVIRRGE